MPPSGSPYTFGCPARHYLCPSSASYGCCPDGMGCAVNQCYSTDPTTVTRTMVITSSAPGSAVVVRTTTATTVEAPAPPTAFPTVGAGDGDQKVLKYFPSAIPKVTPAGGSGGGGGGGGISAGQLGGIVAGAVSFVVVALVAALLLFRRLSARRQRRSSRSSAKRFDGIKARAQMMQVHAAGSDADAMMADPLMMASPPPSHARPSPGLESLAGSAGSPEATGSAGQTPTSFGGGFQSVGGMASRHASLERDGAAATPGYFDSLPGLPRRFSGPQSVMARAVSHMSRDSRPLYSHVRQQSDASSASSGPDTGGALAELEAQPYVAELPSSPAGAVSPVDERQRSALVHRRERSDGRPAPRLDVVDEELIHGYHGPTDRAAGQTAVDRREARDGDSGEEFWMCK